MKFKIIPADLSHTIYSEEICQMMADAAKVRGTGIAQRQPAYVSKKMIEGKAIVALDGEKVIGFCYIEDWENEKYIANSGLIVHPDYRKMGLAKAIKQAIFKLSKEKYPKGKLFGITTSMAVMKINSSLGYKPVTFSELTTDEKFWNGCASCVNYDVLQRTNKTMCICTGMICDLSQTSTNNKAQSWQKFKLFLKSRKVRIKTILNKFPQLSKIFTNEK